MHLPKQDRYRQGKQNFLPSITIEIFRDLILYLTFDPIPWLGSCFNFTNISQNLLFVEEGFNLAYKKLKSPD